MDILLGYTPKGFIPMEIFVHPYIPMILPTSSQCGTLVVYPTILSSNKGPPSLPSNDHIHLSTQPRFFILYFTVLGLGHVHEAFGEHTANPNRADSRITSWSNWGPPSLRIHPPWLTLGQDSDTTCWDYGQHLSPHWYDIVHFGPKPSWICSWVIPQKASYQWRYLSILIYPWSSSFLANVGLWSYTQHHIRCCWPSFI